MSFHIQVSNPSVTEQVNEDDETIGEAIESIFPLDTEHAFISWNGIYIPVSYKYDLSLMYDDIVQMIEALLDSPDGELRIQWPSNTFAAVWNIKWAKGQMKLNAEWRQLLGSTERLLDGSEIVDMDVESFVAEWRPLLVKLYDALTRAESSGSLSIEIAKLQSLLSRLDE